MSDKITRITISASLLFISVFFTGDYTISRILGIYCILKAVALVHCTLYIHYKA